MKKCHSFYSEKQRFSLYKITANYMLSPLFQLILALKNVNTMLISITIQSLLAEFFIFMEIPI